MGGGTGAPAGVIPSHLVRRKGGAGREERRMTGKGTVTFRGLGIAADCTAGPIRWEGVACTLSKVRDWRVQGGGAGSRRKTTHQLT